MDGLGALAYTLRATPRAAVLAADTRTRNETLYLPSSIWARGSSDGRPGTGHVGDTGIGVNLGSEVWPTSPRILRTRDTASAKEPRAEERRADMDVMNPEASMPVPQSLRV